MTCPLTEWTNKCIRKMTCADIACVKLSSAAFMLMLARLWKPLLALDWYWYLVIALAAAAMPASKMFRK